MALTQEPERLFFRIVIGCYRDHIAHWSARDDLRANGLEDRQICSLGSRLALSMEGGDIADAPSGERAAGRRISCDIRQLRELEIHVSAPALFDRLWPAPHHHDGSLVPWMTPAQSGVIWHKLREDCPLLMVSADSALQQVKSSQIQLRHGPSVVQAFNFAV